MKLFRSFAIAAVLALSVTACLKDKTAEQAPAEQPAATEQPAAAPTETPAQDATQPTTEGTQAAPADSGNTQSAQ
jgi:hypothetical protein